MSDVLLLIGCVDTSKRNTHVNSVLSTFLLFDGNIYETITLEMLLAYDICTFSCLYCSVFTSDLI